MRSTAIAPRRDIGLAYILWLGGFFGLAGIHRIYMGRTWSGLLWMFTGGLCMVGQIIDLFMMSRMIRDANERAGW
jgi:TM2 domain-containing membrane protein YozV